MPEGQFRGDKPAPRLRNALDVARRVQGLRSIAEDRGLGRGGEQTGAPRGTRLAGQGAVYAPGDPDSSLPPGIGRRPGDKVYSRRDLACRTRTPHLGRGSVPRPSPGRSRHPLFLLCSQLRGAVPPLAHASPRWGPGQSQGSVQSGYQHWHGHPKTPLSPRQPQVLPCPSVTSPGMHRDQAHRAEPGLARGERGQGQRGHVPRRGCRGCAGLAVPGGAATEE